MKITRIGPSFPLLTAATLGGSGGSVTPSVGSGLVPVSTGSNAWAWGSNVQWVTSNGSNILQGPFVNFASGSNVTFAVASNTLTISATGGSANDFLTTTAGGGDVLSTVAASGATETINLTDGNYHAVTLTANCTFTFAAVASGRARWFTLRLTQDGTGGRTSTWPGSVSWIGGAAPTLVTTAGTSEILTFHTLDGGTTWLGAHAGGGTTLDYAEAGDLAAVGETASAGVSTEVPRADHVHTIAAAAVQNAGRWEVVVSGSGPPVAVSTPSDDDWVYAFVT